MIKKLSSIFLLFIFVFFLSGCSQKTTTAEEEVGDQSKVVDSSSNHPVSGAEIAADKLEVYYFHTTARCYSCKAIGRYIKETMEQKYSQEIQNGLIDFKEINIDLPENKEVAGKYQASGSSLYINQIKNGQDNIEQDTNVWRFVVDEVKFKDYLENKINVYLGR